MSVGCQVENQQILEFVQYFGEIESFLYNEAAIIHVNFISVYLRES